MVESPHWGAVEKAPHLDHPYAEDPFRMLILIFGIVDFNHRKVENLGLTPIPYLTFWKSQSRSQGSIRKDPLAY